MARKSKKRKPAEEGAPGAPEWVVTFTDMISLLVTFFVLLMTFSSLNRNTLRKVDSWLEGSTSVLDSDRNSLAPTPADDLIAATDLLRGALQPHARPQEALLDNLDEMGQKLTEEHHKVDLSEVIDGLVVEFGEDACFAPGSIAIPPALRKSLGELGRVLEHYPYLVVVEGFTDTAFQPTPRFRMAEQLAAARAGRAAEVLLSESGLAPHLVQAAGLGVKDPRGDNDTPAGRLLNRRVQVRILSLSKLRASHLNAQEQPAAEEL